MSKARDLANAGTALGAVTATELGYVDGVTSAIQTQMDAKLATATASSTYVPKSTVTAKGDILAATGSGTLVAQAIGANGTVLTADSAEADGLKWAALPASGSMTLLASGTLASTGNTTISSISGSYKNLVVFIKNYSNTSDDLGVRVNGVSTATSHLQFTVGGSPFYTTRLLGGIFTNNAADKSFGKIEFLDYTNTTTPKFYSAMVGMTDAAGTSGNIKAIYGMAIATTAITSLVFFPINGTIAAGSYELYGVN